MHPHTAKVKSELAQLGSLDERIRLLRDAYAGSEAVVLSCGPSFGVVTDDELRAAGRGRVVIFVKQAIKRVPQIADFHVYNHWNFERVAYANPATIRFCCAAPDGPRVFGRSPEFQLPVRVNPQDRAMAFADSLAGRHDFETHVLSKTVLRPWGPGIMYEGVIYLLEQIGVRSAVCVGWDLGTPQVKAGQHFYMPKPDEWTGGWSLAQRGWRALAKVGDFAARRTMFQSRLSSLETRLLHWRGKRYNVPTCVDGENEIVVESSAALNVWLKSRGIALSLASDCSHLSSDIHRCRLGDLPVLDS